MWGAVSPSLLGEGSEEVASPRPIFFLILDLKMATLSAFRALFFTVHAGAEGWGVGMVFLIFGFEIAYYGAL